MAAVKPSPSTLWYKAEAEHRGDRARIRERYLELMREYGHIVTLSKEPEKEGG